QDPVGTDGKVTVRAMIPKGEMQFDQFRSLAEISEIYGNKKIYTTNRQNIEIQGVWPDDVDACKKAIEDLGYRTDDHNTIRDIVPCVGTRYCPKAVSKTHDLYDLLMTLVNQQKYDAIKDNVIINITGCPNSCSPYRIADLGFRGMRIREGMGSVEGYEMLIGGTGDDFGKKVGEFKLEDCPKVVEKVLDTYIELREGEESLADCIKRIGFTQ
ncbi:MAG: hypothetical protein HRT89_12665, partial [Lentisphaeria bacterium]|nr:hypothetical protein [Lentisphaeria bacterium]